MDYVHHTPFLGGDLVASVILWTIRLASSVPCLPFSVGN